MLFNLCVSKSILRFFLFNSNVKCFRHWVNTEHTNRSCSDTCSVWLLLLQRYILQHACFCFVQNQPNYLSLQTHFNKRTHTHTHTHTECGQIKSIQFILCVCVYKRMNWTLHKIAYVVKEHSIAEKKTTCKHANTHYTQTHRHTSGNKIKITNKMCYSKEYKSWLDQREIIQF